MGGQERSCKQKHLANFVDVSIGPQVGLNAYLPKCTLSIAFLWFCPWSVAFLCYSLGTR
uniref:Uncharacterized protein n=1 Tax=Anguilla anguilla TaxID=7936 RepID=A0A0E9TY34_ANGAN